MSCSVLAALAAAATLNMTAVETATPPPAVPPSASLAVEPFYADIVSRSIGMKAMVDRWIADQAGADAAFAQRADWTAFREQAEALSRLDMQGHVDLRERNIDGDLKCILRGLSEDIPRRVEAVEQAADARARADALSELAYLLDDNAAVIAAPPQPPV